MTIRAQVLTGAIQQDARVASILHETFDMLCRDFEATKSRIRFVELDPRFTVVELDDGNVGVGASYYKAEPKTLHYIRDAIKRVTARDPILGKLLFSLEGRGVEELFPRDQRQFFVEALRTSIVSALSSRVLRSSDGNFESLKEFPRGLFEQSRRALLIGYGGFLDELISHRNLESLHISDFSYHKQRQEMDSAIRSYRLSYPRVELTIDDGSRSSTGEFLRVADLVCVTASTLCNGTLDALLENTNHDATVVIWGRSAAIYPKALFDRGVDLVKTTIKPQGLLSWAKSSVRIPDLRSLIEQGPGFQQLFLTKSAVDHRRVVDPKSDGDGGNAWFDRFALFFAENGYNSRPVGMYRSFLRVVDRPGKILELGSGNGLLLRFLREHSRHHLELHGVEIQQGLVARARTEILPDRAEMMNHCDLLTFDFSGSPFDVILANPIHADRGYSEQENHRLRRYYGDGTVARFIRRCYDHLTQDGRLVLWCFESQFTEISQHHQLLLRDLSSIHVKPFQSPLAPIKFWIADRRS
jgi:hypothetical protein